MFSLSVHTVLIDQIERTLTDSFADVPFILFQDTWNTRRYPQQTVASRIHASITVQVVVPAKLTH
jgi:hypothetical protein